MRLPRLIVVGVALAAILLASSASSVFAQWPTTCVDLNDIVETHLGNHHNVGIYQRVFGDQAEQACQNDHRDDVRGVFAWAFVDASQTTDATTPVLAWPTDCVDLNDIVENHLGNHHNVGIYQRVFGNQAEPACRKDHRQDVRGVFAWAFAGFTPTSAIQTACIPTFSATPPDRTAVVSYFQEIAFGTEFGTNAPVIRKWDLNLEIKVHGVPKQKDKETLNQVISELNEILGSERLRLVDDNANVDIHFASVSQFPTIEPTYVPGSDGFVWMWWRANEIHRATILISTDLVSQNARSHLIREELTQALGLAQDSYTYPESIFYQPWTETTSYMAIDRELIRLLYLDEVVAGMSRDDLQPFLNRPFCSAQ